MGGTPWQTTPGQDREDDEGVMPDVVVCVEVPDAEEIERPEARSADVVPRGDYLRGKEFEERGYTRGCNGCTAMMKGDEEHPSLGR